MKWPEEENMLNTKTPSFSVLLPIVGKLKYLVTSKKWKQYISAHPIFKMLSPPFQIILLLCLSTSTCLWLHVCDCRMLSSQALVKHSIISYVYIQIYFVLRKILFQY